MDDSAPQPIPIPATDEELLAQCRVETFRSGGKGGQHQNTTDSGVRLFHEPSGLTVEARRRRSQARNKADALHRLRNRLEALNRPVKKRVPTRVPGRERLRRLEKKRKKAATKRMRKKPDPDQS